MIEAPIPQDILKYKAKFIGNFSARQAICLGLGIGIGAVGQFILFKDIPADNIRTVCSFFLAALPLSIGFIPIYGQPLEKIGWILIVDNFINPATRVKEIHFDEQITDKTKKTARISSKKKIAKSKEYKGVR